MDYEDLISGGIVAAQRETGFAGLDYAIGAGSQLIGGLADIAAGGPQKRERTAREMTKQAEIAAQAQAEQNAAALEIAKLQYAAQAQAQTAQPAGGLFAHKTMGIPTVALVAAAGLAAFLLLRK